MQEHKFLVRLMKHVSVYYIPFGGSKFIKSDLDMSENIKEDEVFKGTSRITLRL